MLDVIAEVAEDGGEDAAENGEDQDIIIGLSSTLHDWPGSIGLEQCRLRAIHQWLSHWCFLLHAVVSHSERTNLHVTDRYFGEGRGGLRLRVHTLNVRLGNMYLSHLALRIGVGVE